MATKKEKLKLYRIITHLDESSSLTAQNNPVRGYINRYSEFKRWDVEKGHENEIGKIKAEHPEYSTNFFRSKAPFRFFGNDEFGEYNKLAFVIDGESAPYDRNIHSLEELSARVFIVTSAKEGSMTGKPYLGGDERGILDLDAPVEPSETLTFRINPTGIKVQKKKLFSQVRTRGGWTFQHWGPQIGVISLEGTTGNITPPPKIQMGTVLGVPVLPQVTEEIPSASNSAALKAFRKLEKWYDRDQGESSQSSGKGYLLALEYRQRIYVGHIADFLYEERGTNPFQLYYKIKFLVHYDAGNLSEAVTRSKMHTIRNAETLEYIRALKNPPNTYPGTFV